MVGGYGKKPHTSILPFLREQEKQAKEKQPKKASKDLVVEDTQKDPEALKTMLKHIHPTATEDELESMIKDM